MKKHSIGTALAVLLAAAVILAGLGATHLAEDWLFPASQPVYVPAGDLPTTALRLENDEYLQLYPMDEYFPGSAIPAVETTLYEESCATFHRLILSEHHRDDIYTEERITKMYHTTLNNILAKKVMEFFRPDAAYPEADNLTLEFDHDAYMIDALEYQSKNDLFYLRDFHVTLDLYPLHGGQSLSVIPGNITVAFRGDLLGEMELVYLRFDASSSHTELIPAECYSWLLTNYRIYQNNPASFEDYPPSYRPLENVMTYLSRRYNALRGSDTVSWERLEENFDCILYRNEVLCILSGTNQQVVFTYDPEVDCFVEFSIRAN